MVVVGVAGDLDGGCKNQSEHESAGAQLSARRRRRCAIKETRISLCRSPTTRKRRYTHTHTYTYTHPRTRPHERSIDAHRRESKRVSKNCGLVVDPSPRPRALSLSHSAARARSPPPHTGLRARTKYLDAQRGRAPHGSMSGTPGAGAGAGGGGGGQQQRTHVKLTSAEDFEFIVDYKAACVSNTIRNMLTSGE